MRYYSDYTLQYVQDICNALNGAGVLMNKKRSQTFEPENFDTLTDFLQNYVVAPIEINAYLNEKGLVNRDRCPYTGQRIDNSFPKWTYMHHRSIYTSHEGFALMKKEADENFVKTFGHPPPQKKAGGCYIATVCYGNEFAPEVLTLKTYRDDVLSKTFSGKTFIKFYYMFSPFVARQLQNKTALNSVIKEKILDKIVNNINRKR